MNRQGPALFEAPLAHEMGQHVSSCTYRECRSNVELEFERGWGASPTQTLQQRSGPRFEPTRALCPPPPEFSPAERTALAVTTRFETGTPYGCVVSRTDGISFGMLQWNLRAGTLQRLLSDFDKRTNRLQEFFGAETDRLRRLITLPRNQAIQEALDQDLANLWRGPFLRLCAHPSFCGMLHESIRGYMRLARAVTIRLGLQTVRGLAMMFDIAVGDWISNSKERAFAERIKGREAALGRTLSEQERLIEIAKEAAARSGLAQDRLPRRLLIANGTGKYRGSTNWNLDRDFLNLNDPWRNARPVPDPSPGPTPTPSPSTGRPLLRYGSRGPVVQELQSRLNMWLVRRPQLGLPRLVVDGIFGPLTGRTVRVFQQAEGLRVDGIVGPQTWGRLLRSRPSPVPPSPQPTPQPQGSGYPRLSRFIPARYFTRPARPRQINRIVIHITAGGSNINGTIRWFQDPASRVSAHYIVGQDGEVVQMVRDGDIAWHAGSANHDSIGIEHVARPRGTLRRNDPGLFPTQAQYCSSADLVRWLCRTYNIPLDRVHILGHSEADPHTTHTGCPNAVWDWNRYMNLVTATVPC